MSNSRTNSNYRIALSLFSLLFLLAITSNIAIAGNDGDIRSTPIPTTPAAPASTSTPGDNPSDVGKDTSLPISNVFSEYNDNLKLLKTKLTGLNKNLTTDQNKDLANEVIGLADKIEGQSKELIADNSKVQSEINIFNEKLLSPLRQKLYLPGKEDTIKEIQKNLEVTPVNGLYGSKTRKKVDTFIDEHINSIESILNKKTPTAPPPGSSNQNEPNKTTESPTTIPSWLPWLGGGLVLFGVEAAQIYMIWKYREKIKDTENIIDANSKTITKLTDNVNKNKTEIQTLKQELSLYKQDLNRAREQQQIRQAQSHSYNPTPVATPTPISVRQASYTPPAPAPAPVSTPEQRMVSDYNTDRRGFSNQYTPTLVAEDAQALSERWGGEQKNVVLAENSQGDYWIFSCNRQEYLVPTNKITINEFSLRTVGSIFECENYTPSYRSFQLIEPAKVSVQSAGTKQSWQVVSKGRLLFS